MSSRIKDKSTLRGHFDAASDGLWNGHRYTHVGNCVYMMPSIAKKPEAGPDRGSKFVLNGPRPHTVTACLRAVSLEQAIANHSTYLTHVQRVLSCSSILASWWPFFLEKGWDRGQCTDQVNRSRLWDCCLSSCDGRYPYLRKTPYLLDHHTCRNQMFYKAISWGLVIIQMTRMFPWNGMIPSRKHIWHLNASKAFDSMCIGASLGHAILHYCSPGT